MKRQLIFLERLDRFADPGLLLLRVLTGAFLVHGVADNIVSAARMEEFSAFLAANGFVAPLLMAMLSVAVQFLSAIALMLGLLTRWAGIVIGLNFVVAALVLVGIGLQFALTGGGRWSLRSAVARPEALTDNTSGVSLRLDRRTPERV